MCQSPFQLRDVSRAPRRIRTPTITSIWRVLEYQHRERSRCRWSIRRRPVVAHDPRFELDESTKQLLEKCEVGVELAAGVVAEPSGRFAGSESEDRSADEAFGLFNTRLLDTRLLQRRVDAVARPTGPGRRRWSLEEKRKDTRMALR